MNLGSVTNTELDEDENGDLVDSHNKKLITSTSNKNYHSNGRTLLLYYL
jgi:hypothetical protein